MLSLLAMIAFISSYAATANGLGAQEHAPLPPVAVVDGSARVYEGQLLFRLQNEAALAATAWRVAAEYALADGTSQRIVYGREAYMSFAGLTPAALAVGGVVPPGERIDVAIPLPESWPTVSTVHLQIESVIFADGSAFGPRAEVEALFARRAEDRIAWSRVRAAFEEANNGGTGDAVARAIDALDFPGDPRYRHRVVVSARNDLKRLINGDPRILGGQSLHTVLTKWVSRADAHIAAATRHSTRR